MGSDSVRYFLFVCGRWRWRPTKKMKQFGFRLVTMGTGDPIRRDADGNPAPSDQDIRRALELNRSWDLTRSGAVPPQISVGLTRYPKGSVGEAYQRAMALRKAERIAKGIVWSKEQEGRDDWPRAWRWLGPEFGDCDARTIIPEHFLRIDEATGLAAGLIPRIEREVSITERHRTIKVWRALFKRMQAMGDYCGDRQDPSKAFRNSEPDPRNAIWLRHEVLKLVQIAWRNEFFGLAALMAVSWDSMLSPVDGRSLTPAHATNDGFGIVFALGRAKTGRAALGTLSPWSRAILRAYLALIGVELLDNAPLFWTRGGRPVGRQGTTGQWGGDHGGGAHVKPRPYSKSAAIQDFATVRELAFGKLETRNLSDMRRSGAVEGDAGGASLADQSNKMANTVDTNKRLRKTYNPVNAPSVRRFDDARSLGAKSLREQRPSESVITTDLMTLLKKTT